MEGKDGRMIKKDVLIVGQTPPPFHGQAVVTDMLFKHDWTEVTVECLRMSYSDTIDGVGKASFKKIFHLFYLIWATWIIVLKQRPKVLYYLPASANKLPVIRDLIYLTSVKWLFKKKVYHYHAGGLPEYLENAGLLGKLAKRVYSGADVSMEICQTEYPPFKAFRAKKQVIIPNGLDVKLLARSANTDLINVLFVGALNEGKGVFEALKAVSKVSETKGGVFNMQFAGAWASDSFRKQCEDYVIDNELSNVTFLGVLKGEDKWQAYANADIFFFPSHYESENFPLVLIEAMACGLPIISTRWRGIPQLLEGSKAAELCDIKSQDQFVSALVKLISDQECRLEYAKHAKKHYLQNFTREKFVKAVEREFLDLVQ